MSPRARRSSITAIAATLTFTMACSDADPEDGDGGGGAGGDAASQCTDYLACVAAATPAALGAAIDTYGDQGSCWSEFDIATCASACADALGQLQATYPNELECLGDPELFQGLYFVALEMPVSAKRPVVMTMEVTTTDVDYTLEIQLVDADDRRTLVGTPMTYGPYPVALDAFSPPLGTLQLPGTVNPLTDSTLVLSDLIFTSTRVWPPPPCGTATGQVTSPITLDISGSTFAMMPISAVADAPEPPVLDCAGTLADPLQ